jgi:hypothetical protein
MKRIKREETPKRTKAGLCRSGQLTCNSDPPARDEHALVAHQATKKDNAYGAAVLYRTRLRSGHLQVPSAGPTAVLVARSVVMVGRHNPKRRHAPTVLGDGHHEARCAGAVVLQMQLAEQRQCNDVFASHVRQGTHAQVRPSPASNGQKAQQP